MHLIFINGGFNWLERQLVEYRYQPEGCRHHLVEYHRYQSEGCRHRL